MDITEAQISEIEAKLVELETLDPAELPEPASELVTMLTKILEESSDSQDEET